MKTTREQINRYLFELMNGEDCLEEFIDYSRGYMQYIAYKYLADKSLVEDVVFSAYDRILSAVHSFDSSKNGLAWIVKITQNEAYRLNRNAVEVAAEAAADENKYADSGGPSFDDGILDKYDVEQAIAKLDAQEREIIESKIFMGMTVREIAKQTGMPKSSVAYVLKRALKKLEKYLE
ncbi:MAG: sigma-70 family RNA polymerase sigma factor [Roseburia sp.]|nr:sigma-70 family RNA polymerase sigma factor [Roseburia sp.]